MRAVAWVLAAACVGCAAAEGGSASTPGDAGAPDTREVADSRAPGGADAGADDAGALDAAATLDAAPQDALEGPDAPSLPPAAVSGRVAIFGPPGGPLAGARVRILEHPGLEATSDADGYYRIPDVPAGDVTLVLEADGYPENQLGTQTLAGAELDHCDFQAVSQGIYDIFAALTESTPDPTRCQVSTTITRWFEGDLPTVHGEPGATATIEPLVDSPTIYFNAQVLPTPGLVETTVDGGVVWTNVAPGDYLLRAHKGELPFETVRIRCRPGVLVNAAPPRGLQALAPGGA